MFFIEKLLLVGGGRWGVRALVASAAAGVETDVDGVTEDEEKGEREKGDGGCDPIGEFVRRFVVIGRRD